MTAKEFIDGLRERGHIIIRLHYPVVVIPRLDVNHKLVPWFEEIGCGMKQYRPDPSTRPELTAYEVRLQRARVEVPGGMEVMSLSDSELAEARAVLIWDAAGPPPRPVPVTTGPAETGSQT